MWRENPDTKGEMADILFGFIQPFCSSISMQMMLVIQGPHPRHTQHYLARIASSLQKHCFCACLRNCTSRFVGAATKSRLLWEPCCSSLPNTQFLGAPRACLQMQPYPHRGSCSSLPAYCFWELNWLEFGSLRWESW